MSKTNKLAAELGSFPMIGGSSVDDEKKGIGGYDNAGTAKLGHFYSKRRITLLLLGLRSS